MILTTNNEDSGIFDIAWSSYEIPHTVTYKENNECEHLANQVYNFVKSWFRELSYCATTCFVTAKENIMGAPSEYVIPSAVNNNWKKDSKGLYIAIHGVNGRPNIWHTQLAALQKQQPGFDIRIPHVPKKGNCSLDEAVAPIESMIRDYIRENPLRPICLMGVSNGARIAAELEIRLRDTQSPIKQQKWIS